MMDVAIPPKLWTPPGFVRRAESELLRPRDGVVFLCPPPFMRKAAAAATPAYRTLGAASDANTSPLTPGLPASNAATDFDILVVAAGDFGNVPVISTPSGWTLILSQATGNNRLSVFYRDMDGTESGPSVSITNLSSGAESQIYAFTGVGVGAAGIEASSSGTQGSTTTPSYLQTTTTGANRLVVHTILAVNSFSSSWTALTGWTNRGQEVFGGGIALDTIPQAAAGTTAAGNGSVGSTPSPTAKIAFALLG